MKVLAIYIEPTPYVINLIRVLRRQYGDLRLRVLFISANVSQPWDLEIDVGLDARLAAGRLRGARQLLAVIRNGGFDWLHLAGWGHPLLLLALAAGRAFGHRISVESDTQAPISQSWWRQRLKCFLYPHIFQWATLFFPGGTPQKRYLISFKVPEHKIRIAQMTVDVESIMAQSKVLRGSRDTERKNFGISTESVVFVYIGRLEMWKGISSLFQALSAQSEQKSWQLLVVGDGASKADVYKAQRSDSRIRYLGRQDSNGVVAALSLADVAVVPSLTEPWGLVVNESMAAGLPVIVTDRVGAAEDLVVDGENGLVVPAGSSELLCAAMLRLASDEAMRLKMGASSLRRISRWRLEDEAKILWEEWCQRLNIKLGVEQEAV